MEKFENVTYFNHPLIQHKISILRKKETGTNEFRHLVEEIAMLEGFEALNDLPLEEVEIETPIEKCKTPMIAGRKLAIVPILRAGLGMVEGILALVPSAKIGHIGLYRDEETFEPHEYYCKLPSPIEERTIVVCDPMLATGGSAIDTKAFESHTGVNNLCRKRLKAAICFAVVLHEYEIPDFNYLRMIVVHEVATGDLGAFFSRTEVDMDFGTRSARSCITHFPEVVVFVTVDDVILWQELFPIRSSFVVTAQSFFGTSFKYGCIEMFRIQFQDFYQIFPRPYTEVDTEVKELLKECYEKAKKLLSENREAMDRIADYLFKKENITGKQFMALFEGKDPDAKEEPKPEENEKPQIEIEIEKKEDTADTEEVNTEEVDKEEE